MRTLRWWTPPLLAAAFLAVQTLTAAALTYGTARLVPRNSLDDSALLVINSIALLVAGAAVLWLGRDEIEPSIRSTRGHVTISARLALPSVLLILGAQAGVSLVVTLFGIDAGLYAEMAEQIYRAPYALSIVTVAIIPAVMEELAFREVIQGAFIRRLGPTAGVASAALLFGAVHVVPIQVVAASILGLALGYLRYRSGTIYPAIIAHAAANGLVLAVRPDLSEEVAGEIPVSATVPSLITALVLIAAGIAWVERTVKRSRLVR